MAKYPNTPPHPPNTPELPLPPYPHPTPQAERKEANSDAGYMSSAVRPDPTELTVLLIFPHRVQLELAVLNGLPSFFHLSALRVPGRTPDKRCQRATEKTNSSKTPGPNHDTQKTMSKSTEF